MEYIYSDNHFKHPNILLKEPSRLKLLSKTLLHQQNQYSLNDLRHYAEMLPYRTNPTAKILALAKLCYAQDQLELLTAMAHDEHKRQLVSELHDTIMAYNLDNTINQNDVLYYLGDFAMTLKPTWCLRLFTKLTADRKVIFIRGNHDSHAFFNGLAKCENIEVHDTGTSFKKQHKRWYLTHYPMNCQNYPDNGTASTAANFHGHTHGHHTDIDCIDVSVESALLLNTNPQLGKPYPIDKLAADNLRYTRNM